MKYLSCCFIAVFSLGWACQIQAQTVAKTNDQQQTEPTDNLNVKSFNVIWQTIKDSHWQPEKVDESWDQHRAELLPKIKAATSIEESRAIMSELIGRLKQSHFGVIPADSYSIIEGEDVSGGNCDIGITIRLVEGQLTVTAVRPDSSAEKAGVRPGWAITTIRDRDAADLVKKISSLDQGPQRPETTIGMAMQRFCSGPEDSNIALEFTDHNHSQRKLELSCGPVPGKYSKFGNLPPIRVSDLAMTLEDNIGYYNFSAFLDPIRIMPAYRKAIRDPNHTGGIVIDLRGNIGGIAAMTMGMAGEFVTEKRTLGTLMMKGTNLDFIVNRRAKPYSAPVAVLIDECSISSAEIFSGGLKDLGLAKVFGSRSAGLALPSTVIKLPNGDRFQYAFADYHSANGKTLEINGVIPDEEVRLTHQNLREQNDPALHAATTWIRSQSNSKSN